MAIYVDSTTLDSQDEEIAIALKIFRKSDCNLKTNMSSTNPPTGQHYASVKMKLVVKSKYVI